jgi:hypothetical protein
MGNGKVVHPGRKNEKDHSTHNLIDGADSLHNAPDSGGT